MKLSKLIVLAALFALVAMPALAVERQYQGTVTNTIYSPTAPDGFTTFPAGTHEGPLRRAVMEDNGFDINSCTPAPCVGTLTLKSALAHSILINEFACDESSEVTGCQVGIRSDTLTNTIGGGNLISSIPQLGGSLGGFTVFWPDAAVTITGGRGQYCYAYWDGTGGTITPADQLLIDSYCFDFLTLKQDAWSTVQGNIVVISPNNGGIVEFSADQLATHSPDKTRYFFHLLSPNFIYGIAEDGNSVSPAKVPLGPLAALALGGSLAYMGFNSLRRKS
jgi:hypothetical protein